ncbi:hypothetical protein QFZ82_001826 [Streptomyces sp. V4I23]|uniref:DUF4180 domain-containing protein n=1 Tax=Streptomyces sp. V4I23 TaxID=3042282 RepID=UPI0027832F0F|nr:DUF4180 domain-containing protein [Streptomyces sp. V4I23]MDQ1007341.1 hypothetical protein [Streptomyces sp. V4I23]
MKQRQDTPSTGLSRPNHRLRLIVIGDISRHLEASSALRALAHESSRSDQVRFVPDVDTLDSRLKAMA